MDLSGAHCVAHTSAGGNGGRLTWQRGGRIAWPVLISADSHVVERETRASQGGMEEGQEREIERERQRQRETKRDRERQRAGIGSKRKGEKDDRQERR